MSLWEFSLSLALLAIVCLMSAPLYYKVLENFHVRVQTNRLVASLNLARVQAIRLHRPVSVCSSSDGASCTATPWERGYIVFVDTGAVGVVDPANRVLERQDMRRPKVTITLAGRDYIRFDPAGSLLAQAPMTDAAPEGARAARTLQWLRRLSPISPAYAETEAFGINDTHAATRTLSGIFTVCSAHTGRTISVSLQGRISTHDIACPDHRI